MSLLPLCGERAGMKCFFTVYTPLSRARAHAHIREFALFAFTTFTEILTIDSN